MEATYTHTYLLMMWERNNNFYIYLDRFMTDSQPYRFYLCGYQSIQPDFKQRSPVMSMNTTARSCKGSLFGCKFHLRYLRCVCGKDKKNIPCIISPECGSRQPILYTRIRTVTLIGALAQPVPSVCIDSRDFHENLVRKPEFGSNLT